MSRPALLLETIEERILCAATPAVTIVAPANPLIGEVVALTATFDNASATDTGYGPYADVYLPATGTDGAGAAIDDGLTFVPGSANFLGAPVTTTVLTFNAGGNATHPYAKTSSGAALVVTGTPGDQLVVFQLPFGSFTPNQPPAAIAFSAQLSNLADANQPLSIQARGGFQYGNDALDNPTTDPSFTGLLASTSVTPSLFTLTKTYLGPEDETATGPNFTRQYLITVDVANGQTLTNLQLTDLLPNNLQFVNVDSTAIRGTLAATTATATPSTITPGGTLTRQFASVTGTTAANDATLLFTYYVPRANSLGNPVLNAVSGDDVLSVNDARAQGNWVPIDGRDTASPVVNDATANDHTLTDKSIAIQKSVTVVTDTGAAGASPGDTLEYTMTFQISDYFAFQNLIASDIFSDGQKLSGTFTPTLTVSEHGATTSGTFNAANFTLGAQSAVDGTTPLTFRISSELVTRGLDGKLLGGNIPNAGTGGPLPQSAPALNPGTIGTITFRTVIQDNFDFNFPSGDQSVDQGDVLGNNISIAGDLLSVANATTPTGQSEADTSAASVSIVSGALTKSVYAINGNTSFGSPVKIAPGDTVTYRLTYTLPTSDVEALTFTDFLPLPVFNSPTLTTFDNVVSAAAPIAGHVKFGPSDTFSVYSGIVPVLSTDATSNSVTLSFGNFDSALNTPTTVDLLLTVTATANPFADGLFLTNQARVSEGTTNAGAQNADAIIQIQLTEPVLNVRKGVVATDKAGATFAPGAAGPVAFNAPGTAGARFAGTVNSTGLVATPINSNLSGIDAGDLVTFAIVVENTGSGLNGAFDVRFRDTLPAGFAIPGSGAGLNLRVVDGTGAAVAFTTLGTGLFDAAGGLELNDPGTTNPDPGAIDRYDAANGRNLIVVTYDLAATSAVQPGQTLTNTATLTNFAGVEAGPDHTLTDLFDTATVTVATPTPSKSIVSTSEAFTALVAGTERAAIGEVIRYRLVTQLPEGGATNLRLVDALPTGLTFLNDGTAKVAFVSGVIGSLTSSTLSGAGLEFVGDQTTVADITPTFTLPGGAILGGAFATGTDPTFVFGNLTNSDSDANNEFVVLEFNALADNSVTGSNDAGDTRSNTYRASVNGTLTGPTSNNVAVIIAESALTLSKSASPSTGDAGDTVNFTVTLTNGTGNNVTPAFESQILDTLPGFLVLNLGSVAVSSAGGVTGIVNNSAGSTVDFAIGTIPAGGSITVTYSATINSNIAPGQTIVNTAAATTTSLPGANGTTSNPTGSANTGAPGADNGERTGSLVNANDLRTTAQSTVTVAPIIPVKTIVATSEAATAGSSVAIGEVVRYRLQVQVPESNTLTNFQLGDALPAGLTFLNDGTARVALVGNAGGITSSTLTGAGLFVSGNEGSVNGIAPSFVLPGAAISGGPFLSGADVVFSLGTLDNADRDADWEFVVIEFNALVDNSAAGNNQAGSILSNTFTISLNGSQSGPASAPADVTVVEPVVALNKSVSTPTGDAGDIVTFTVTYTNTGASAFDARLTDAIPASMTLNVGSVTVTPGGGASGVTSASAGNTLDLTLASLPNGGSVIVTYTATLNAAVTPGQVITNNAQLTYTSLPGASGTIGNPTGSNNPGAAGSDTGERNGSGGLNDYLLSTAANLSVPNGSISKSLVTTSLTETSGSNVAVGETATYALTVTLPEGSSPGTFVIDTLPAGLAYVGGSAVLDMTGFGGIASLVSTTAAGSSLTFNLGTVAVTSDNNPANNTFIIRFTALVQDVAGNEGMLPGQTLLPNSTTLQVNGGTVVPSNTVTTTVIEPQLQITKTLLNPDTTVDAGTVMNYQVVIQHTASSTGPAFDLALADALAGIGLNLNLASVTITPAYNGAATGYVSTVNGSNASGLNLTINRLDLGDTLTITYSATVSNSTATGSTVTNTASLTAYDTVPGVGGRVGTPISSGTSFTVNTNTISGYAYRDLNNNALFDEAAANGLGGVPVRLLWAGFNGTFGDGDDVTFNSTTAGDGSFQFTGLHSGNYQLIEVTQPAGLLDGQEQPGNVANPFGGTVGAIGTDAINGIVIPADSNQSQPNYNFGELPSATLGNFVWRDADGNGRQDGGEPGVDNVTVTLTGTNDLGAIAPIVTTTAGGGIYNFGNLRPGSYQVAFSNLPAGAVFTAASSAVATTATDSNVNPATGSTGNVTLVAGQSDSTFDAGIYFPLTFGDRVCYDANNNGTQDAGEPGISGVTVTATWAGADGVPGNGDDVTFAPATTGANGLWSIGNLPPGTYTVTTSGLPGGLTTATFDLDGIGTPSTATLTVATGANRSDIDFGYRGNGTLGDLVWNDTNGNGTQDAGEPGIPNAAVTLTWFGQDGVSGGGDDAAVSTTSDASGLYQFTGLPSGNFSVAVSPATIPGNLTTTFDLDGPGTANTTLVTLAPGQTRTDADFGYVGDASIGDKVWYDLDGDGTLDAGEPGIANVTITLIFGGYDGDLTTAGDNTTYTTTTDSAGNYLFQGLPVGTAGAGANYRVATSGVPSVYNSHTFDIDGTGTANTADFQLAAWQSRTDLDFGYRGNSTLSGFVYADVSNDGVFQSGGSVPEQGIAGVTVTLTGTDAFGNAIARAAVTAVSGAYSFDGLITGTYTVTEQLQVSPPLDLFLDGNDTAGTAGGNAATVNDRISSIVLGGSVTSAGNNLGELVPSSLAGSVFIDANGDGVRGADEAGIENATVTLTGIDDLGAPVNRTSPTDPGGNYIFGKLRPGTYAIAETQPVGYFDAGDAVGSVGGMLGNDVVSAIALAPGQDGVAYTFGEERTSLSGTVFIDTGRDGVLDPADTGRVAGVTLTLRDTSGAIVATVQTDAAGNYLFGDLLAGDYTIAETQPDDYGTSTVNSLPVTIPVTGLTDVNFGETTGSISGTVYHDLNNDGLIGATEPLIAGAGIALTGIDVNGAPVSLTATTLADGSYTFTGLLAGTYSLTETQPAGFEDGRETVGSAGGNANVNDVMSGIGIGAGMDETGYLFGERTPSDLVVTKTDGLSQVKPGKVLTYTITIRNPALQDADSVIVTDQFPANVLDFIGASHGGVFDAAAGTIRWSLGALAGSDAETITLAISARVKAAIPAGVETFTNIVTARDSGLAGKDPTPVNNTARDTDRVKARPDLYVLKTDNLTTTTVGDTVAYAVSGGNAGDEAAGGVIVRDALPKGVRFVSASDGGSFVNGEVVWNLGTLAPGGTFTLTVNVVVEAVPGGGQILNPVTIEDEFGNSEDPTLENNRAFDLTGVKPMFVPPTNGLVFAFDAFHDFSGGSHRGYYDYADGPEIYRLPILPLAPVYSGEADPGATLFISLVNARGVTIGEQTVMVDAGGNWLATFPSATIRDVPSSVRITEIPAPYSIGDGTGFNLRTYFSPALNPGHFFTAAQMSALPGARPAPLLQGLGLENPLQLGSVKYGGEMLGSQATASGY